MSVEFALAIPPTVDLCLKYGTPSLVRPQIDMTKG